MDKHKKTGYEESEFVDKMEVNQTAIGGIKAVKVKTIAARQPSPLACIKFWVVVVSSLNHATYSLGLRIAVGNSG